MIEQFNHNFNGTDSVMEPMFVAFFEKTLNLH